MCNCLREAESLENSSSSALEEITSTLYKRAAGWLVRNKQPARDPVQGPRSHILVDQDTA